MVRKKQFNHIENHPEFEGLNVNKGISQPDMVNADSVKRFLKKKKNQQFSANQYVDEILNGNVTLLSKAVTLIESSKPDHQEIAQEIIAQCLPHSGHSVRIGITGIPGVGKSTFIEAMGTHITAKGGKLAVLAIDPSSARTKGSILGDKTRMEDLSANPHAYIRPSPSAGSLGGVARKTRETIVLCEAAGFDTIFIETVGVGQSETAVHSMVDFFLLLMLAGAGDELQGIKRGIMEMADIIAINKADGNNLEKAGMARIQYENALHLFPPTLSGWKPKVLTCSAFHKIGIEEIWESILEYLAITRENHYFQNQRNEQSKYWMYESINEQLKNGFYENSVIKEKLLAIEQEVLHSQMSSFAAAQKIIDTYKLLKNH